MATVTSGVDTRASPRRSSAWIEFIEKCQTAFQAMVPVIYASPANAQYGGCGGFGYAVLLPFTEQ